jgi:hypothetical protein
MSSPSSQDLCSLVLLRLRKSAHLPEMNCLVFLRPGLGMVGLPGWKRE